MEGPHIDTHTFVEGVDHPADSWQINYFSSIDVTNAWTQLSLLVVLLFTYGVGILYYVHTKKFGKETKKQTQRHSKAWKAWDKNKVNFNYPYITRHNDFLGWNKTNNAQDFQGYIYTYCMPTAGPFREVSTYLKQKMLPGLKFNRIPMRAFFFHNNKYLDADRLCDVPKKYPFHELSECVKEIELYERPSLTISLPHSESGKGLDMKVTTNFTVEEDFKVKVEEMFERLKFDIAAIDGTEKPETKKLIFETKIMKNSD